MELNEIRELIYEMSNVQWDRIYQPVGHGEMCDFIRKALSDLYIPFIKASKEFEVKELEIIQRKAACETLDEYIKEFEYEPISKKDVVKFRKRYRYAKKAVAKGRMWYLVLRRIKASQKCDEIIDRILAKFQCRNGLYPPMNIKRYSVGRMTMLHFTAHDGTFDYPYVIEICSSDYHCRRPFFRIVHGHRRWLYTLYHSATRHIADADLMTFHDEVRIMYAVQYGLDKLCLCEN